MNLEKRIIAFTRLGEILRKSSSPPFGGMGSFSILAEAITNASKHNGWFTEENILLAIGSLGEMLREDKIRKWISKYPISNIQHPTSRKVGVIMAGNIPLVGFHDFLCVLISGNTFVGKLSSDDEFLLPAVTKILCEIEPAFANRIQFTNQQINKSANVSAFIATGSNNSARYFEYYFKKYPHIIRKNRNAIAVLDGKETEEDLKNLGKDIFQYFGMGCRNVSKIYIPQDYNLDTFFSAIVDFGDVINHNKYYNNHIYHRTIYLLNQEKFLDNNFLMLKESATSPLPLSAREGKEPKEEKNISLSSPVATLYYERYKNQKELNEKLLSVKDQIQCIASNHAVPSPLERVRVRYGQTQNPELWDYADGVDTMKFLLDL
ncbi:MAG: acyl-CoA reductase [Bacteroidetes bacterium]|nr:acyl-CoA reductase [Bacteroidota bacterium]